VNPGKEKIKIMGTRKDASVAHLTCNSNLGDGGKLVKVFQARFRIKIKPAIKSIGVANTHKLENSPKG
jgi:hypothetical protein